MTTLNKKNSHIHSRISNEDKKIIEWGARVHGLDLSDYIRVNMLEKAKKDIERSSIENRIRLNDEEWARFLAIMDESSGVNENLVRAFQDLKNYTDDV